MEVVVQLRLYRAKKLEAIVLKVGLKVVLQLLLWLIRKHILLQKQYMQFGEQQILLNQ
jgi:hypothetical protein